MKYTIIIHSFYEYTNGPRITSRIKIDKCGITISREFDGAWSFLNYYNIRSIDSF